MKKILRLAFMISIGAITKSNAQCDFTPTINPRKPILCPFGTDTLVTQKYDSYQWFRNNRPIAGATSRTYVITQDDIGYAFKVEATKNGCSDTSRRVIADGYVFLLPFIIESGDIGVYDPLRDALIECPDDTLVLTLGDPYTLNIQWYDNFKAIKGANEQTYYVTTTGSYTACGAPEVCPQYIACENIPINVIFENPTAEITEKSDTLFSSRASRYQWFLNNQKIPDATERYYVPSVTGKYKVATADKFRCIAVSDPYFYMATGRNNIISVSPNPVQDILHIHINATDAARIIVSDLYGKRLLQSAASSGAQNISLQNIHAGTYLVQVLNKRDQKIASTTIIKQ